MIKHIKAVGLAIAMMAPASAALAVDEHFIDGGAVVGGYDVVAYHTMGKPTMGSGNFSATFQGAT